ATRRRAARLPDTAPDPPHPYTLSLHDALPIWPADKQWKTVPLTFDFNTDRWYAPLTVDRIGRWSFTVEAWTDHRPMRSTVSGARSEEHTSELQSQSNLVCRLLLEKKKNHMTGP